MKAHSVHPTEFRALQKRVHRLEQNQEHPAAPGAPGRIELSNRIGYQQEQIDSLYVGADNLRCERDDLRRVEAELVRLLDGVRDAIGQELHSETLVDEVRKAVRDRDEARERVQELERTNAALRAELERVKSDIERAAKGEPLKATGAAPVAPVLALRAEVQRLGAEVERLERQRAELAGLYTDEELERRVQEEREAIHELAERQLITATERAGRPDDEKRDRWWDARQLEAYCMVQLIRNRARTTEGGR